MKIIYEDKSIIVINKPAGLATQSASISQKDCVSLLKAHLKKNSTAGGESYLGIIHRLDQPVGGILVFAKTPKAASILSGQVQTDIMNKCYEAIVEGRIEAIDKVVDRDNSDNKTGQEIQLINYMYKDAKNSKAVIVDSNKSDKNAKRSELSYRFLSYDEENDTSHLSIVLKTGRFHQIRAQMSYIQHPILGDRKYGSSREYKYDFLTNEPVLRASIALKAVELTFRHPDDGRLMSFSLDN